MSARRKPKFSEWMIQQSYQGFRLRFWWNVKIVKSFADAYDLTSTLVGSFEVPEETDRIMDISAIIKHNPHRGLAAFEVTNAQNGCGEVVYYDWP